MDPLRSVVAGSRLLAIRSVIGFAIGCGGLLITARLIGAADYGRYATVLALTNYAQGIALLGINTWIIRAGGGHPAPATWRTAIALLLASGTVAAGVAAAVALALHPATSTGIAWPLVAVIAGALPLQVMVIAYIALLESQARFAEVAAVEVAVQILFQAACIGLAADGAGPYAPALAGLGAQALGLGLLVWRTRLPPLPGWDRTAARGMLGFGMRANSAHQVWQLRNLVVPLVVTPLAGVSAAGVAALAIRILDQLSFPRSIAWRVGLPALARTLDRPEQAAPIVAALQLGQVVAIAGACAALALALPVLAPLLGGSWSALGGIAPLLAGALLMNAAWNMPCGLLLLRNRIGTLTAFHATNVALLAVTTAALAPRLGVQALAIGEAVACSAYAIVAITVRSPRPPLGLAVTIAIAGILAAAMTHPVAAAVAVVAAALAAMLLRRRVAAALIAGTPA